jgi:hypothetical protein
MAATRDKAAIAVSWINDGFSNAEPATKRIKGRKLMGWMAPAPIGVAMRDTADVHICL